MLSGKDVQEAMEKVFEEITHNLHQAHTPVSDMHTACLKQLLESQILILTAYQDTINHQLQNNPMSHIIRQMTKNFMLLSRLTIQSEKLTREMFLRSQASMLRSYTESLKAMLAKLEEKSTAL